MHRSRLVSRFAPTHIEKLLKAKADNYCSVSDKVPEHHSTLSQALHLIVNVPRSLVQMEDACFMSFSVLRS